MIEDDPPGVGATDNRGDAPSELLTPVPLGGTASAVTAGASHNCALRDDGQVVCWGGNFVGQLGIGTTDNRGNTADELPTDPVPLGAGRSATAVTAGDYHNCALRDDGQVVCWGHNAFGQLGVGATDSRGDAGGELPTTPVPLGGLIRTPALSVANVAVSEGTGGMKNLTFTILRTSVYGTVSVAYTTVAGTAAAGRDYSATSGRATLAQGVDRATVAVPLKTDPDREPNETFTLQLSAPIGATIADANATGTIRNDDARPQVSVRDAVVTELDGSTTLRVRVVLDHRSFEPVNVWYRTVNGSATAPSDYTSRSGVLTIPAYAAGSGVRITIKGDLVPEASETFHLAASATNNATLDDPVGTIVILDDD